jgi:thiosulfate reductase/polysulfide reductase chain A
MSSRREFIRISFVGAGVLAVAPGVLKAAGVITDPDKIRDIKVDLKRTPTYCEVCFWKCAGWVYKTSEGKVWKVIGNDEDQHCNGRFCPRGTGGVGMYYDEDRLKTPLIRTGERGKQVFREASWDEALSLVASKIKDISSKYGPESLALFTHGSGSAYYTSIFKALGSGNVAEPSYAQCRGDRKSVV